LCPMPPLFRTRGSTEVQQGMPPQT
jgi:hypothetical protein